MAQDSQEGREDFGSLSGFIEAKRRDGIRGFVFGERHDHVGLPNLIASEFNAMKCAGITTLYVEYIPFEMQATLNHALQGDEKAQMDIRAYLEVGYNNHQENQARYDLIMSAHEAGLRVFGIDSAPDSQMAGPFAERLIKSDPYMTEIIRANDDGKGFVSILGRGHTYASGFGYAAEEIIQSEPDSDEIKEHVSKVGMIFSNDGGFDSRLREQLGIPVISIDLSDDYSEALKISTGNGVANNYVMALPKDPQAHPKNEALGMRGVLSLLEKTISEMRNASGGEEITGLLEDAARHVTQASQALASETDEEALIQIIAEASEAVFILAGKTGDPHLKEILKELERRFSRPIAGTADGAWNVAREILELRSPEAQSMWRREPMSDERVPPQCSENPAASAQRPQLGPKI